MILYQTKTFGCLHVLVDNQSYIIIVHYLQQYLQVNKIQESKLKNKKEVFELHMSILFVIIVYYAMRQHTEIIQYTK